MHIFKYHFLSTLKDSETEMNLAQKKKVPIELFLSNKIWQNILITSFPIHSQAWDWQWFYSLTSLNMNSFFITGINIKLVW